MTRTTRQEKKGKRKGKEKKKKKVSPARGTYQRVVPEMTTGNDNTMNSHPRHHHHHHHHHLACRSRHHVPTGLSR
jgi:hypothetical protein